jgi:hypothetical protein
LIRLGKGFDDISTARSFVFEELPGQLHLPAPSASSEYFHSFVFEELPGQLHTNELPE